MPEFPELFQMSEPVDGRIELKANPDGDVVGAIQWQTVADHKSWDVASGGPSVNGHLMARGFGAEIRRATELYPEDKVEN